MKLLLHFDINKTIIVNDASTGRGVTSSLHTILSEAAWGIFPADKPIEQREASDWTPILNYPSTVPPMTYSEAVTFGAFLEDHTKMKKPLRRQLKTNFANPDGVGHVMAPYLEELSEKMAFPSSGSPSLVSGESLDQSAGRSSYFILPSFFTLLDYLFSEEIMSSVDWRIAFRSFGIDGGEVVEELNQYLKGEHPVFKPKNIEETSKFIVRLPHDSGSYLRTGPHAADTHLSVIKKGVITTVSGAQEIQNYLEKDLLHLLPTQSTSQAERSSNMGRRFILLRDDYRWWDSQDEADHAGKLLLLHSSSLRSSHDEQPVHQLFFDDNIERDRAHIVDVRDMYTFTPVPFAQSQHSVLIKAEPYDAIMNSQYFVDKVSSAIQRWTQR